MKRLIGQFPLTGGKIVNPSGMRILNVRSYRNQHFIFGHRDLFDLTVGELEHDFLRVHEDLNVLIGPSPFVGESHSFRGINAFQLSHEGFLIGMEALPGEKIERSERVRPTDSILFFICSRP